MLMAAGHSGTGHRGAGGLVIPEPGDRRGDAAPPGHHRRAGRRQVSGGGYGRRDPGAANAAISADMAAFATL